MVFLGEVEDKCLLFFYMKFEQKFRDILSKVLENYESIFLIDITFGANNDVKVFLDAYDQNLIIDMAIISPKPILKTASGEGSAFFLLM